MSRPTGKWESPPCEPFGVYVHVPFCATLRLLRLRHLDGPAHLIDAYLDACVTDLDRQVAPGASRGDVGVLRRRHAVAAPARRAARILAALPRGAGAEVTVEWNPDSIDRGAARGYRAAGVNRLSIGVQSMARRCSPRSAGPMIPTTSCGRSMRPRRRHRARQRRPDLRDAAARRSTTGAATLDGALALDPRRT